MKKRIFSLVFIFVLLTSAMVLAFSVQRTYAKYSSASNVTQSVTLEYEAHSGTSFTVQQYTNTQHKKTWSCCGYVVYESHAYSSDSDFECDCGYVRHEHTYTLVSKVDSTCTSEGTEAHYVCNGTNGCGKLFDATTRAEVTADSLTIAKKAHSYTVAGNDTTHHFNKCSGCGAIDESSKVAHSAADNTYYSDENNHWKKCSCGYNVDVAAHMAVPGGEKDIHKKCSVCSRTLEGETYHDKNSSKTKQDATCTAMGITTYTCSCGYKYDETDIVAKGHSYTQATADDKYLKSEATCQSAAIYYKSCVRCGLSSKNQTGEDTFTSGDALEHIASAWTRLDDNRHYKYCTRSGCGETVETGNHNQDTNGGTSAIHKKCSVCGTTTSTAHSYTDTVKTAATCTATGTMAHTCSCGYSYESDISMISHTSVYGGTAQVHTKCSVCGNTLSSTHSYSSSVYTNPTCTEKGTTKYSCSCGYSYTSENINALGHDFNSSDTGSKRSDATCTAAPTYWRKCTRCNAYSDSAYFSSGSSLGHVWPTTGGTKISGTQHQFTCTRSGCSSTKNAAHTLDCNTSNGGTYCSGCPYHVVPSVYYSPTSFGTSGKSVLAMGEWVTAGQLGTGTGTYFGVNDSVRGAWNQLQAVQRGGNLIQMATGGHRYLVIQYTCQAGDTANSTLQPAGPSGKLLSIQYGTDQTTALTEVWLRRSLDICQDTGLCCEIIDLGASATSVTVVNLYLWINNCTVWIKDISFFTGQVFAEEYQDMLACNTSYPVYDCGYATYDESYSTQYSASRSVNAAHATKADIFPRKAEAIDGMSGLAYPVGSNTAVSSYDSTSDEYLSRDVRRKRR